MLGLNWFDVVLLLLLGLGLLSGYMQGLLRQIITLAALYLGAVVGAQYYYALANPLKSLMATTPPLLINSISFFIILLAVVAILVFLAHDASKLTIALHPAVDHLGGMILGLVTVWIFITIGVNVLQVATQIEWPQAENLRQLVDAGVSNSFLAQETTLTLPTLLATIRPWLPIGLPSIFNLS